MAQVFLNKADADRILEDEAPVEPKDMKNSELADEIDDLLADIDGILEENAERFVAEYIQKGGE
jgi:ubiquitin-like protein Pup